MKCKCGQHTLAKKGKKWKRHVEVIMLGTSEDHSQQSCASFTRGFSIPHNRFGNSPPREQTMIRLS